VATDVEALTVFGGHVAKGHCFAESFEVTRSAHSVHRPVRGLTNQGGSNRRVDFGIFIDEVSDALFGHLGGFGRQAFGGGASTSDVRSMCDENARQTFTLGIER